MIAILISGAVALLVAGLSMPLLIERFTRLGVGQHIREDGPKEHIVKAGTPTMGGLGIILAVVCGYLAAHANLGIDFSPQAVLVVAVCLLSGMIGYADDYIKVKNKRSLGLTKSGKFVSQVAVALGFALAAHYWAKVPTSITFVRQGGFNIQLGTVGWLAFATFVIVATSNAVNLTDGLDGLAAGASTFSFGALTLMGYWQFRHFPVYAVNHGIDVAVVCVAMVGGLSGFLWWNAPPAKIFMGDTGSLGIGSALGAVCLVLQLDLLLVVIAGLFVLETLSVIGQVFSFRVFHRRIFKMAPMHHHFELLGWPETTVLIRLWMVAGICTAIGMGLFYADFLSLGTVIK